MKRNKTGIFTHLQRNLLNESPFYASARRAKDKHEVSWTPNNGMRMQCKGVRDGQAKFFTGGNRFMGKKSNE